MFYTFQIGVFKYLYDGQYMNHLLRVGPRTWFHNDYIQVLGLLHVIY